MVFIKIKIYVRHKAEAQLQIGMLREPQDLGERAAGCLGGGEKPTILLPLPLPYVQKVF